jgi:VCBS repeat-containing protein
LGNDTDVDGDALTVVDFTQPSNGTLVQKADGSFTYTPDENFCGIDSYTYTISDGNGGSDTATVTINVACVNDAPVAVDDSGSTDEDTVLNVAAPGILDNDYDVDGDSLTVSAVNGDAANVGQQITLASGALLTVYADGSYSFDPNGQYDYLAVGETAEETYTYAISDGNGGSDTATVTITIVGVNDAPVAVDDAYTGQQDETLSIAAPGTLVNDYDVDGDAIFVDSYDTISQFGGSISMNADGSFSYTPAPGFAGYDTFTYTISDGNGGYDTATVTITVEAKNNRSISVQFQEWTYDGTLRGSFSIKNQSGPYPVQIDDLAIEVQYRVPGGGGWTYVAVAEDSCSFDPMAPFVIGPEGEQLVSFYGCELAEEIPDGATVRVTAKVHIFGRIKGGGKSDGWFLDRLSKEI